MDAQKYRRTDLAVEMQPENEEKGGKGYTFSKRTVRKSTEREVFSEIVVEMLVITDKNGEETIGKPQGCYVTVRFDKPWLLSEDERRTVSDCAGEELKKMLMKRSVFEKCSSEHPILVVGLGNRQMTADAIGPGTADKVTVTGHIAKSDRKLFETLGQRALCAIVPGVTGDTGMESAQTVKAVSDRLLPAAVIAVDALAARSSDRLARTVQLCDTGIAPGSGVGNDRPAINEAYLGVPVFALGVPMVTDSCTLVVDALEKAGIEEPPDALLQALENGRGFFVSLKEADAALEALSDMLAATIDTACRC